MSEQKQNEMKNLGILDLRGIKSPEDLKGMRISNTGVILVKESMLTSLSSATLSNIGVLVPVPDEEKVTVLTGNINLTQDILGAGDEDTILIVAGMAIVSTPIERIGYKELRVIGMLVAPKGSEQVILPKLAMMSGEMTFCSSAARMASGMQSWNRAFLEALPDATTYILLGCQLTIEDDVTADLLRTKISEITLMAGDIKAPPALVPILHVLVLKQMGEIKAKA